MKKRQRPEQVIQKAIFDHLRLRGVRGMFAFHPANGGWRTPAEGAIFRGLGVVAGTPDIFVVYQGRCYCLELKAGNRKPTEAQSAALAKLEEAGACCEVAFGLDQAIKTLEAWGILRGTTSGGHL